MNLIILTQDYPYGTGEPFLEKEILIAKDYFDTIYVVSTSQSLILTRVLPTNVIPIKLDRAKNRYRCIFYAFRKLFSKEILNELLVSKNFRYKYNLSTIIRDCIITWLIEKRYQIGIKKLNLNLKETVFYSYWFAAGSYYISNLKDDVHLRVSRVHSFEIRDHESYVPFREQMEKNIDKLFFISNWTKHEYESIMLPIRGNHCDTLMSISRLGVSSNSLKPSSILSTNDFTIVSCSDTSLLKRLDIIVDVLANINEVCQIKWIHFGNGVMLDEIKLLAEVKLSNKGNITWNFMGQKSNEDILHFYANNYIDLFINTSDIEGIPVSIMEAMSFGIPCMGRDVGGINELIINEKTGYLLKKDATIQEISDRLSEVIISKMKNEDLISRITCAEFINANFNMTANYGQFYKEIQK